MDVALLPGTIANDFRTKTATSDTGGRDETKLGLKHSWDKLLLAPEMGKSSAEAGYKSGLQTYSQILWLRQG